MSVAKATLNGMAFATAIIAFVGGVALLFIGPMYVLATLFQSTLSLIVGMVAGTVLACGYIAGFSALLEST